MQLNFAPMEGLTSCLYRQLHAQRFPGADRYYAPFLAPDGEGRCRTGSYRDILPEHNGGIDLVPQILCNRPEPFLILAEQLKDMGYCELNLNIGCPSSTVVAKHKGAGMLADLHSLDTCLSQLFESCPLPISVKTRLGLHTVDEFPSVLEIYNKYPLKQLIIHARDRAGMYKSMPDLRMFAYAAAHSRAPVCYNGNLFSPAHVEQLLSAMPDLSALMIGRGAVANPALFRQLRGGLPLESSELAAFQAALADAFLGAGLPVQHALARLKELWFYWIHMFSDSHRLAKQIFKARSLDAYTAAVQALFEAGHFSASSFFDA